MTPSLHRLTALTGLTLLLVAAGAHAQVVAPLGHPSIEQRLATLDLDPDEGFRFVVFGDQKNLWKRDFPRLLDQVRAEAANGDLVFMLDTGDIVDDGHEADQFEELRELLTRVADVPYLVGVGNHELQPEGGQENRTRGHRHTAAFLGDDYDVSRMFFSRRIGPLRLLFLNTNDLLGVYPKLHEDDPAAGGRAAAQMRWLVEELRETVHPTIAVAHHAFVQSPRKHRGHANGLWNQAYPEHGGRTLPEILADGGVDLVLSGHVHSYEVLKLQRRRGADALGAPMWSVNASGRPTGWFSGSRMPSDWRGREMERLADAGFTRRIDRWLVTQLDFMDDDTRRNQLAIVTVDAAGTLRIELRTVDGTQLMTLRIPEETS